MHDAIRQEFTTSMPWMLSTVHGVEYSAAYFNAPKACAEIARLREIEAAARAVVEVRAEYYGMPAEELWKSDKYRQIVGRDVAAHDHLAALLADAAL